MKLSFIAFGILLLATLTITACKTKNNLDDPTVLQIEILADLEDGIQGKRIQKELLEFDVTDFKATNKTLNQYLYKVTLKGQSSNELLKAFRGKPYVKSAMIAPRGKGPAQNMPSGKPTRTSPIKG